MSTRHLIDALLDDAQAYHHGVGSLKAGRSELGGYSQAASVAKDSYMEDDALLKDEDPSTPLVFLVFAAPAIKLPPQQPQRHPALACVL